MVTVKLPCGALHVYHIAVLNYWNVMVKQNISPEKAVEILKKGGLVVSEKEAQKILDFLYKMAKLEVREALKK